MTIYYDIDDYAVEIGTVVTLTEHWDNLPNYETTYEVVAIHSETGELGLLEITDTSGEWIDWRPNYAIPVLWEWNYQKYAAI